MAKKQSTNKNEVEKLSFEQGIETLTEIVEKIETGQLPLQDSLQQYEKGMAISNHCRKILLDAEKRIEEIADEQRDQTEPDEDVEDDESLF